MSTQEKQRKAYRLTDERLDRIDAVKGVASRTAMIGHLVDLGLASMGRNPEQAAVHSSPRVSPPFAPPQGAASGTATAQPPMTVAATSPPAEAPKATAKPVASKKYVKNAAGRRIPLDANGVPDFS